MHETGKALLDVLQGKQAKRIPIWFMRQAGRYLPEYRELRQKAGSFLNLALTPSLAAEVTLQPLRRFDLDAAIIFADILLIPYALGRSLDFKEGEGPVLEALQGDEDIARFSYNVKKLEPVFEALGRVKLKLSERAALIGFCGGLWTVSCYMIGGNSRDGFDAALKWAKEKPETLEKLMDALLEASADYLARQVEAGAEVLQVFDSWAGLLEGENFRRWILEPTKKLVSLVKEKYPQIPVIGFPRAAKPDDVRAYIRETGVDALSLDTGFDLDYAKRELQPVKPLQGNLDPLLLVKGGADMEIAAAKILDAMGPRHIFNLGHGIVPQTPPEHVARLVEFIRRRG